MTKKECFEKGSAFKNSSKTRKSKQKIQIDIKKEKNQLDQL